MHRESHPSDNIPSLTSQPQQTEIMEAIHRDSSPPYSPHSFRSSSAEPSHPPSSRPKRKRNSPRILSRSNSMPADLVPDTTETAPIPVESAAPAADFIALDFSESENESSRRKKARKAKKADAQTAGTKSDHEEGGVEEKTAGKPKRRKKRQRGQRAPGTNIYANGMSKSDNADTVAGDAAPNGSGEPATGRESSPDESEDDKDAIIRRAHESRPNEKLDHFTSSDNKASVAANGTNTGSSKYSSSKDSARSTPKKKTLSVQAETKKARKKERRKQMKLAKKQAKQKAEEQKNTSDHDLSEGEIIEDQPKQDNGPERNPPGDDDLLDYDEMIERDRLTLEEKPEAKARRLRWEERDRKRKEFVFETLAKDGVVYVKQYEYDEYQPKAPKAIDGREDVHMDSNDALWQRKYYEGYELPPMPYEEDRGIFAENKEPISCERAGIDFLEPISEAQRICKCCTQTGHAENRCPQLWCLECGAWDEHFTWDCPNKEEPVKEESNMLGGLNVAPDPNSPVVKLPPREIRGDPSVTWRFIPKHRRESEERKALELISCYSCGAADHFGGECPFKYGFMFGDGTPFSFHGMGPYITDGFQQKYTAKLEEIRDTKVIEFGKGASMTRFVPGFFPFDEYRRQLQSERDASRKSRDSRLPPKPKAVKDWFPDRKELPRGRGGYRGGGGRGRGGYNDSRRPRSPPPLPPARASYGARDPPRDYVGKIGNNYRDGDSYRPLPSSGKRDWNRFMR